jgi:hypothetical protein
MVVTLDQVRTLHLTNDVVRQSERYASVYIVERRGVVGDSYTGFRFCISGRRKPSMQSYRSRRPRWIVA